MFSGYFAAASSAVIVFYVVATGVEGPVSFIPSREAGLAFGGALSLLAVGWLWPSRTAAESWTALATVFAGLAARVRQRSQQTIGVDGDPTSAEGRGVGRSILEAERAVSRSAWRPDGLAAPHKARMYLLQGARRMNGLLDGSVDRPTRSNADLAEMTEPLISEMALSLDQCAAALASDGRELPDPGAVERVEHEFVARARTYFDRRVDAGATPEEREEVARWYFLWQQLAWGVVLAVVHCRAMHGAPLSASAESVQSDLVRALTDGPSVRKWVRRARRNLDWRSVHLQNSIRLAVGLGLARLAVGVFDLEHGFWVGFATLVVLKTSAAGTRSTAVEAALGTAIGFAVSSALVAAFGVEATVYSLVLPVVIFAAFYLPGAVSFIAGQAFFTMVIVVLFNLLQPSGWEIGLVRLEDVLIGAGIGLAIGMALWPGGAATELAGVVGRLFVSGSEYVEARVRRMVGPVSGQTEQAGGDLASFRSRVAVAAVDAEDVFSQYLAEPHQSDAPVVAWSQLMAAAHQLWFGASVVSVVPVPTGAGARMPEVAGRLIESAEGLTRAHRRLAVAIVGEGSFADEPLELVEGPIDRSEPGAALTLLELEAWLDGLHQELRRLQSAVEGLRRRGQFPSARLPTAMI
ncbi:MAG: FUSC family protein [Acidimicrobiales bacterium]